MTRTQRASQPAPWRTVQRLPKRPGTVFQGVRGQWLQQQADGSALLYDPATGRVA